MAENLIIRRGETFDYTLRWMCAPLRFLRIEEVSNTMPLTLQVSGHGVHSGTPVDLVKANNKTQEVVAENVCALVTDANTLQIDSDEVSLKTVKKNDYVRTYSYVNLHGLDARCYLKPRVHGEIFLELTVENGRILIDEERCLITLHLPADVTEKLNFKKAKYDLELLEGQKVTRIIQGDVWVEDEITVKEEDLTRQIENVDYRENLKVGDG